MTSVVQVGKQVTISENMVWEEPDVLALVSKQQGLPVQFLVFITTTGVGTLRLSLDDS